VALSRTTLLSAISSTSATQGTSSYTTGSFTTSSSSLLVVGVGCEENGSTDTLDANLAISSSPSLTFTQRVDVAVTGGFGSVARIYTAPVASGASTTLTLSCGTVNVAFYGVSVVGYTGYNTGTPTGATGSNTQTSGFATPNPGSLTLSGAPASSSEVFACVTVNESTTGVTPGSAFTEITDVFNSSWGDFESEVRGSSTSTTVDWVDMRPGAGALFNWAAVAVEIQAAAAAAANPMQAIVMPSMAAMQASVW
jgi:hypothetical protein